MQKINKKYINSVVQKALKEDLEPIGDITTKLIKFNNRKIKAKIVAKQNGVVAGIDFCKQAFKLIGKETIFKSKVKDGKSIKKNKIILSDGEKYKNQESANKIYNYLLKNKYSRDSCLVAFGGGVIGDITGYAAATYQRGINFIQIPTTLLSMVDSSVGGKTGINHPLGKNMIGAFHQPIAVIIDTEILKSLPKRQFNAGMAEVIKYGIIKDKVFFDWISKNKEKINKQDSESIIKIVKKSCEIKANIEKKKKKKKNLFVHNPDFIS